MFDKEAEVWVKDHVCKDCSRYKECRSKPKTFKDFKNFIIAEAQYQWWCRCEYEIILVNWPSHKTDKKVDIFWQIMLNIDLITEIVMNETLNKAL